MNVIFQLNDDDCFFPPADRAPADAPFAFGGDLSPERLVMAYAKGIFPWYNEDEPIFWWSLDPRLVIRPGEMKVSKSLRHTIKSGKFECRIDTCFRKVMENCASTYRPGQEGSWIVDEMLEAYCTLHELGLAHSFETFLDGELVGGLYGVSLGKLFCGESMFHHMSDASKVAFYHLHRFLQARDFKLIDCQQETPHLKSLGAYAIPRSDYLKALPELVTAPTLKGNWSDPDCPSFQLRFQEPQELRFKAFQYGDDYTE